MKPRCGSSLDKAKVNIVLVVENSLNEQERRVFASALAAGMLFVESGEVIVAVEHRSTLNFNDSRTG